MSTSVPLLERRSPEATPDGRAVQFHALIVDTVRDRMDREGMSAYKLQKQTGLPPARVYRWFRREYPISLDELLVVAGALRVDVLDLMVEAKRRYDEASR